MAGAWVMPEGSGLCACLGGGLPCGPPLLRGHSRRPGVDPGLAVVAAGCGRGKLFERLVPVGCAGCPASTSGLST